MARRSFVRGGFARAPKRQTDWRLSLVSVGFTTVATSTKSLLASLSAATLGVIAPSTVVRTRGMITVTSDQGAAIEDQIGSFGMAFVNEVARALGVTALPGPTTDVLFDGWFVHQFFQQAGIRADDPVGRTYVIDSKAMRKFDSDLGLVFMCENTGAHGLNIAVQLRMLIKAG